MLVVFTVVVVLPGSVWAQAGEPSPEDAGAMVRALTDAWLGNNEAALTTLSALESRYPVASVYAATADVYANMGRDLDAQNALERASATGSRELFYRVALGRMQLDNGMTSEAEITFQSVLDHDASNVGALLGLSRIEERRGNTVEARRLLDQANATTPTIESLNFAAELESESDVAAGNRERPEVLEPNDEVLPAEDSVNEALSRLDQRSQDLDAWKTALEVLTLQPHPRAVSLAEDALLLFPGHPELIIPAAEILVENNREAEALSTIGPLLDEPSIPDQDLKARGWSVIAIGHALRDEIDEASLALRSVEDLQSSGVAALHAKGHVDAANGNEAAAQEAWRRALSLQPDNEIIVSHLNE